MAATLATWAAAVHIMNDLSWSISALALQAATGLLAVAVLLLVMNWFFHKVYWTGWISIHNERKRELLARAATSQTSKFGLLAGLAMLGFTSFYREGFEVVLFLQSYRLRLGNGPVFWGAGMGLLFATGVAMLTFVAHRKLPYRRMLVLTGMLLGIVLTVMVGEQAQEMQLAGWYPDHNDSVTRPSGSRLDGIVAFHLSHGGDPRRASRRSRFGPRVVLPRQPVAYQDGRAGGLNRQSPRACKLTRSSTPAPKGPPSDRAASALM